MEHPGNGAVTMSSEERHKLLLLTLLRRLVKEKHLSGAAEALGVDPRTLQASMERGEPSTLVQVALERWLAAEDREEVIRLRERLNGLEQEMQGAKETTAEKIGALRTELAGALRALVWRVATLEREKAAHGDSPPHEAIQPEGNAAEPRRFPQLVTWQPAPDDPGVYGEAWPLVDEWRKIWQGHSSKGGGSRWFATEERVRELEVAMMEEHGLTLPPADSPLVGMRRSAQLDWRKETLRDVRWARSKRGRLLRCFTLGRWRPD